MRRPSRSFTVEVKRSRLRTSEPSIASTFSEREELPEASVASSLSWDELLRRLPENLAPKSDQPFITSWPGIDEEQFQPVSEEPPAAEADTKKPRVLPSLLPTEVPLTERKSAVYAQETASWPVTRSRLEKQKPRTQATELQAAVTKNKSRRAFIGQGSKITVEALKKLVETHLQERTIAQTRASVKPVQASVMERNNATAQPARVMQTVTKRETLLRGAVKRRRQDFWKHRLRSYAAK